MLFKIFLVIAVIFSIIFTYWFAFVYGETNYPHADVVSCILMGIFLSWGFCTIVACLVGLWNTSRKG
jgi:hypothetical protein